MDTLVVDFDSSNLVTGQTYSYRVQATDMSGNQADGTDILVL